MNITQLDNDVITHIMASFEMAAVKICYNFALTCARFYSCLQKNKEKIDNHFIHTENDVFGVIRNRYGDQLHSVNDQPASIWSDGSKFWYYHNKWHRDNDLPAIVYNSDGKELKEWYKHGVRYYPNQ